VADETPPLVRTFNFRVRLFRSAPGDAEGAADAPRARDDLPSSGDPLGDGGFQECSGLGVEMDVQEYLEGGRNDGVIKRVGRAKVQPLVLKRGMFFERGELANDDLWRWLEDVVSGVRPVARYDGIVEVLDDTGEDAVARWVFDRGLPMKIAGPLLNARTGEIAIEELHIAHEGLRLARGTP
jgi:phage tail-like protein